MFPSSLPSFTTPTSGETLQAGGHTALHIAEDSNIVAIATKVGTGVSTPTNGTFLAGNGVGTTAYRTLTQSDVGLSNVSNVSQLTIMEAIYPVGCIYTETTGVNPNTTFGFGTWIAFGGGRVLVGNGTSDETFTAGATGGESNHTLVTNEMPAHTHADNFNYNVGAATPGNAVGVGSNVVPGSVTGSTGGGAAHNNLQPYIVVYYWGRTS